jgi:hypothetical protein
MAAFPTIEHFDVIKDMYLRFLPGIVNLSLNNLHHNLTFEGLYIFSKLWCLVWGDLEFKS